MVDITLTEGSLSFAFVDVDFACKYDDWSHYRNQFSYCCGGAKAVDFLVSKNTEIWLIEVKDYRRHRRTKKLDLAVEVAEKVRDTMAGLVSTKFLSDGDEFQSAKAALSRKKLRIALHIEQPSNPSRLFPLSVDTANLKFKLKQLLRFADPHPSIFDCRSFPKQLGTAFST